MNSLNNPLENNPEKPNPITDLNSFIQRQNEIQKLNDFGINKGGGHIKLLEKVLNFQKVLKEVFNEEIDPIKYLEKLYFEDNLSMDSIVIELKKMYKNIGETKYFYNGPTSLKHFLVIILNWKLRNPKESKTTEVYKLRERPKELILLNKIQQDSRKAEFLSWQIKYINISNNNFDLKYFENLRFKYEKLIYLLKIFFQVGEEDFKRLKELNMGNQSLADRFNELFKENNIDLKISHHDIERTFKKF